MIDCINNEVVQTLNSARLITAVSKEGLAISAIIPTQIAATIIITTGVGKIIGIVFHIHRAQTKTAAMIAVQAT